MLGYARVTRSGVSTLTAAMSLRFQKKWAMMRGLWISVAVISIFGCATPDRGWHYEKQGATNGDYNVDRGQCQAQAFSATGNLLQAAIIIDGCMQRKGWVKVSN